MRPSESLKAETSLPCSGPSAFTAASNSLARMASTGFDDGGSRARRGVRAAGHRPRRQRAVAQENGHLVGAEPQTLGCGLADHGVGAVADLMRRDRHAREAVGRQADANRGRRDLGRVARGRAAPADEPVAVLHRSRSAGAVAPAEGLGGGVETLDERAARVRPTGDRVLHRVVHPAQLDRVHVERQCELVHAAFERVHVGHFRRRAHEAGGVPVGVHDIDLGCDRAVVVHDGGARRPRNVVVVGPGGELPRLVQVGEDLAVPARAEAQSDAGSRPGRSRS